MEFSRKAGNAAIGAGIVAVCVAVGLGGIYYAVQLIQKPYVPYTEIVYCDGKEIAKVTARTQFSASHPHVDGDWVVWYKGNTRTQFRVSHCQSVVIRPVSVIE